MRRPIKEKGAWTRATSGMGVCALLTPLNCGGCGGLLVGLEDCDVPVTCVFAHVRCVAAGEVTLERGGLAGAGVATTTNARTGTSVCVGGFITLVARRPGAVDSHESGDL